MDPNDNTPLFPMLLGPVRVRHANTQYPEGYQQEDMGFIRGLRRALEIDLAAGLIPTAPPQQWLNLLAERLAPPYLDKKTESFSQPHWPLPGQPWVDQPDADPREALLARLIHLGADPWAKVEPVDGEGKCLGGNVAGALLGHGYSRLFSLCMQLPGFSGQDIEQTCPSYDRSKTRGKTYLQAAVSHDFLDIAGNLIKQGAHLDKILFEAKTPEMASLLLDAGADATQARSNKPLSTWWLETCEAKLARAMIKVIETKISPLDRFEQAAAETPWTTVKDALDAMPGWQEMTQEIGGASVRLPLALLMKSTRPKNTDQINHALRMEAKAPFDDRVVINGLTEKTLARLTLDRLIHTKVRPIQAQAQVAEKMTAVLNKMTEGQDIEATLLTETHQFLRDGEAFRNTPGGGNIIRRAAVAKRLFPQETDGYIAQYFEKRTLQDLQTLTLATRIITRSAETRNVGDDCYCALVGYNRNNSEVAGLGNLDARRTWLDRLAKQHPDRLNELADGALAILHFQISAGLSSYGNSSNKNIWGPDVRRIEQLLDRGAQLSITPEQALQFQAAANSGSAPNNVGGMDAVIRFAETLPSLLNKQLISQGTQAAQKSSGPAKRL